MGLGKTYSTKYLLDSNNSSGVAGQVLSTTSTGIDWADANTLPGAGLWLANGNDIYNSNSGNVGIGTTSEVAEKLNVNGNIITVGGSTNTGYDRYLKLYGNTQPTGNPHRWAGLAVYNKGGNNVNELAFFTGSGDTAVSYTHLTLPTTPYV